MNIALGFPGGQEVKDAGIGNLGLRDRGSTQSIHELHTNEWTRTERLALRWIQKYIHAFGGDRTKVTMYGPLYFATCVLLTLPCSKLG